MGQLRSKHFATIEYQDDAILTFRAGLPAFEGLTQFILVEHPPSAPLVFLQSVAEEEVCLPALPVAVVDPDYELSLATDDLEALGFTGGGLPASDAMACFAVVCAPGTGPATVNLAAPIVLNLGARLGVQSVRCDTRYSHQHVLSASSRSEGACS